MICAVHEVADDLPLCLVLRDESSEGLVLLRSPDSRLGLERVALLDLFQGRERIRGLEIDRDAVVCGIALGWIPSEVPSDAVPALASLMH